MAGSRHSGPGTFDQTRPSQAGRPPQRWGHLHRHPGRLRFERAAWGLYFRRVAGVDEAGRGPIAGPVTAAAVVLKRFSFRHPIDDSKRLTAKQRHEAFGEILKNADVGIGVIDECTIDRMNIYRATCLAMERAIAELSPQPDYVLVDGRLKLEFPMPYRCIPQGDQLSLSIACASIVAKVIRDRLMEVYDQAFPGYQFARHKGYATTLHKTLIDKLGLTPIHRLSFAPCSSI